MTDGSPSHEQGRGRSDHDPGPGQGDRLLPDPRRPRPGDPGPLRPRLRTHRSRARCRDRPSPGLKERPMKNLTKKQFAKHVKAITTPDGFTADMNVVSDKNWRGKRIELMTYILATPTIRIEFDQSGCGHTHYLYKGAWLCFDRIGVEDSFYHVPLYKQDKVPPLDEIVAEQIARVAKRLEYYASAVKVPGVPFTVAPDG